MWKTPTVGKWNIINFALFREWFCSHLHGNVFLWDIECFLLINANAVVLQLVVQQHSLNFPFTKSGFRLLSSEAQNHIVIEVVCSRFNGSFSLRFRRGRENDTDG